MLKNWPISVLGLIAAALLVGSSGASCNEELAEGLNQISDNLSNIADDIDDDNPTIGEVIDDWLD